jgi:uncharacterized damage-inducible protein DinB
MEAILLVSGAGGPQLKRNPLGCTLDAAYLTYIGEGMSNGDLLISEIPGFSSQVGRLVSMLNHVRSTTLAAVAGLGVAELDALADPESNSIGALLAHIAASEAGYQVATFQERELNEREHQQWDAALALGERARQVFRGHKLDYYLTHLEHVRATTLAELGRRDDAWLAQEATFGGGRRVNNHFKWFHVLTHEVNHRGQIRTLRRRITTR